MQYRQGATLAAYRRAQQYIAKHAAKLGRVAESSTKRSLDRVITGLEGAFAAEVRTAKTAEALTERKHELRQHLRIANMGTIVAFAHASPYLGLGIEKMGGFRLPHIRTNDQTLLTAARALRKAAKPNAAVLIKNGLSRTFLEEFDSTVDELDKVIVARDAELLTHHKYSIAIKVYIRQGRETLDILSALVVSVMGGRRSDAVAEWFSAIRVAGKPGPARKRSGGAE